MHAIILYYIYNTTIAVTMAVLNVNLIIAETGCVTAIIKRRDCYALDSRGHRTYISKGNIFIFKRICTDYVLFYNYF